MLPSAIAVGGGWCGKWVWVVVVSGCGGGVWCVVVVVCVVCVHEKFVFGIWLDHVFCLNLFRKKRILLVFGPITFVCFPCRKILRVHA
jgi:hypothetical protein